MIPFSRVVLFYWVGWLCLFVVPEEAVAKQLRMAMPDYPPYSYQRDGAYHGEGYQAFVHIMAQLDLEYTIELVPHFGRTLLDIENDSLDGFFMASPSKERDAVAVLSSPVIDTRWSWVWLAENNVLTPANAKFKQQAQVSGQMNSNIYHWLNEQGYQVAAGTNDIRGLFALLDYGRVEAIMLPEETAYAVIESHQLQQANYVIQPERELSFGIYISKNYLKQHPDFMLQLNEAIRNYHTDR